MPAGYGDPEVDSATSVLAPHSTPHHHRQPRSRHRHRPRRE